MFGGVLRTAAKNRKNMLNGKLGIFSIFGGVLRTAAKNRKKCETKTLHFFGPSENFPQKFPWSPKTLILHVGYNLETLSYFRHSHGNFRSFARLFGHSF